MWVPSQVGRNSIFILTVTGKDFVANDFCAAVI